MECVEISAKTVEAALEMFKEKGYTLASYEVLQEPKSGFLGFGRKPAIVRAYYEEKTSLESPSDTEKEDQESPSKNRQIQEQVAQKGLTFLRDLFAKMNIDVTVTMTVKSKVIYYQVEGQEEIGVLIGKHGQTLDAIQYLTSLVATKDHHGLNRYHIVVDVENYRDRRADTLKALAKRMAEKAKYDRQKVRLEPMSAMERKVIHMALAKEEGIITDSEGQEPFRYVTISYKA